MKNTINKMASPIKKAVSIRKIYNLRSPIKFKEVIEKIGITVSEINMDSYDEAVDGYIIKNNNDSMPRIFVNKNISLEKKRFVIAHQLGHYFNELELFKDEKEKIIVDCNCFFNIENPNLSEEDIAAHLFAEEFLVPEDEFRMIYKNFKDFEIIADLFKVSAKLIEIRVQRLELK